MNKGAKAGTLISIALLVSTLATAAAPRLVATVGFAGRFVPEHLAPLRVKISNIGASFTGALVISQRVGNPWRGEAESRIESPLRLSGAEELEYVVPIYDFIHPLKITLLTEEQETLAEETVELRTYRQEAPFPLAVGAFPVRFDETAVTIDSKALPRQWAAYEATSSLWIGRITGGILQDQWQAIGQWVLAGGTLVLFTGADFYLLDSPVLRDLSPLEHPRLVDTNDVLTLHGEARVGTSTILTRNETPLLLARRVGAGTVFLVTASAFALAENELLAIRTHVPTARLVSLESDVKDLLEETPLPRPGFLAAILLVLATLTISTLVVSRTKSAKATLILLFAASGLFCVLSGFYTNRTKHVVDLCSIKTTLFAQASFGIKTEYYGLFVATEDSMRVRVTDGTALVQQLPRSLQGRDFRIDSVKDDGTWVSLNRGEHRFLRSLLESTLPTTVLWSGDKKVRIKNGLDGSLQAALVIVNGTAFPIGKITVGERAYELRNGIPFGEAKLGEEYFTTLYRTLTQDFSFEKGIWLVGARERQSVDVHENTRSKVRELSVYVIAGEAHV